MQVRTARKCKKAAAIWAVVGATAGLCLIGGMAAGAGPGILAVTTVLTGAGLVGAASIGIAALVKQRAERVGRAVRSARQARNVALQEQPQEATATRQNSPEWIAAKKRHESHMEEFRARREEKHTRPPSAGSAHEAACRQSRPMAWPPGPTGHAGTAVGSYRPPIVTPPKHG